MQGERERDSPELDELRSAVEEAETPEELQAARRALDRRDRRLRKEGVNWALVAEIDELRERLDAKERTRGSGGRGKS